MLALDVNVLVHAHRREAAHHPEVNRWLKTLMQSDTRFGIPEMVFSSFVRVVTLPKPWSLPSSLDEAFGFCTSLQSSPACLILHPSDRHWTIFERLSRESNARGNLLTDAYLAAFSLDLGCEWITFDQDFGLFPGLRWRSPLETGARANRK